MARQLPFEVFVTRKIAKWEARAKDLKVDLVDAVGVDPIEEMIFFWNGFSRMGMDGLQESLRKLASPENQSKLRDEDDKAISYLLEAAILRALRKHTEAKDVLKQKVLVLDRNIFKGHLRDNWVLPAAHFEMAVNLWMERPSYVPTHIAPWDSTDYAQKQEENKKQEKQTIAIERKLVQECDEHLEKAARWESYELDTRIGLKVTAAREAIRKWNAHHPASGE